MTCWNGWRTRRISETCKLRRRSSIFPTENPTGSESTTRTEHHSDGGGGEIIFIQSCHQEVKSRAHGGESGDNSRQSFQLTKNRAINRLLSQFFSRTILRGSESDSVIELDKKVILPRKMDHSELVKELSHIEKLTNQERLKLAHNRRKLQLKCWTQYEKLISNPALVTNNSGGGGGSNKKLALGKNNQQQQRLLEQFQQQEALRKRGGGKGKRNLRFCNAIILLEAAGRNDIGEVRRLLQDGVDPDVANEDGLTALHQCCIDDNEEMMKLLVESGANVNSEDSEKWTPLHAAATCGHLHLVKHLIVKGANLLAVNAEGNMPYDICDEEATLDYIEGEMAKRGVTQELIEEIRALPETRMLEDMQKIEREEGDLESRDRDGATYLHIASANGYNRVVEFLLDHHVATDVQDKDCWQPVHAAACWSHVEALELLVGAGADLDARTKNNETAYAICEDPEIKERIIQLRSEQETKMKESGVKKLRRSVSSNSRTQSIRRTSQREKQNATKRDAADEAAMLLAIATTTTKDSSPSPTTESLGIINSLQLENHITCSSEEEPEGRSLPPWASGRDSITELHLDKDPALRNLKKEGCDEDSTRLNNSTRKSGSGRKTRNDVKVRNELNKSLVETGGTKYQNPISTPTVVLTDTNANLSNTDINTQLHVQSGSAKPGSGTGTTTIRLGESNETSTLDLANNTIDIRVQVTINTNGSCSGSLNSLPQASSSSSPRATQVLVSTSPIFAPSPGTTLSDLKKQRSLNYTSVSRNSNPIPLLHGLKDYSKYESSPSPTSSLKKFSGEAVAGMSEESEGRQRCCRIV